MGERTYSIEKAAVIGAGTMGLGIAGQLANADVDVLLLDTGMRAVADHSHGYRPAARMPIPMAGRGVYAEMEAWLDEMRDRGKLTPHDCTTGAQVAMIVTGGDVDQGAMMREVDILEFGTHLRN